MYASVHAQLYALLQNSSEIIVAIYPFIGHNLKTQLSSRIRKTHRRRFQFDSLTSQPNRGTQTLILQTKYFIYAWQLEIILDSFTFPNTVHVKGSMSFLYI